MILAAFGIAIAGALDLLTSVLQQVLPADAFATAMALGAPLSFLVPPTFAATVPLAFAGAITIGATRLILNLVGRK